jgi:hypothetical protein
VAKPAVEPIEPAEPIELAAEPEAAGAIKPPRIGVEIVESVKRGGTIYHTVRDLRNGSVVRNVTRKSARKLWHYAITQHEQRPADTADIKWLGDLGLMSSSKRAGAVRYDFVQRQPDGQLRVYYGVTEDGIHGEWRRVAGLGEAPAGDGDQPNEKEAA